MMPRMKKRLSHERMGWERAKADSIRQSDSAHKLNRIEDWLSTLVSTSESGGEH